jgi:hypothetical protein
VPEGVVSGALVLAPCPPEAPGAHGQTLEERLSEVLKRTRAHEQVDCPVCRGAMSVADDGALCSDCGSLLS